MQRLVLPVILTVLVINTASAGPLDLNAPDTPVAGGPLGQIFAQTPVRQVNEQNPNFGGGFLEMLFRGPGNAAPRYEPNPIMMPQHDQRYYGYGQPGDEASTHPAVSPRFNKQVVN